MSMSEARPFRFGVVAESAPSREQWVTLVRKAEDIGYAVFLLADHYVNEFPPIAALMAAAGATSSLRVGSFVFDNDFRHPALLAKEVATLDLLSDGRFELGIGAGWAEPDYARTGIPYDRPAVRIERMAEALAIIKGLLAGGPVTFAGEHYQVEGLEGIPLPVQRPHPPLLLGGAGKRMLALAAREADIVSVIGSRRAADAPAGEAPLSALGRLIAVVREAAGSRLQELELNTFFFDVAVDDDSRRAREALARKRNVPVEDVPGKLHALAGTPSEVEEQLLRLRQELGISY